MQIALAVEGTIFLLLIMMVTSAGAGLGTAVLIFLFYYFGLRILAVGNNFLKTWKERSPRPAKFQLEPMQSLRLFLGELYATILSYTFFFPFESRLVKLAPEADKPGRGTPIVLVPGFCCNRGYWGAMAKHLSKNGLGPVYAVTLEPLLGSMEANAGHLEQFVEAVCEHSGAQKVILVGHSMGGVVARVYLHEYDGEKRIAKIITLGSPHEGTVVAHMLASLGRDLQQMCYQNEWANEFNEIQKKPCPVPITSIITPHDNIVAPQRSAVLRYPNARNVILPGIGHLEMPISKPVMEAVVAEIRPSSPRSQRA